MKHDNFEGKSISRETFEEKWKTWHTENAE